MNTPQSLLDDRTGIESRHAMLDRPHVAGLTAYVARLRGVHGLVPDADPADGGVAARLLLLLETPGPGIGRSGIVSADNPTGTGRNLRRFFAESGIARSDRVIWNAIPWVIHQDRNRAPRQSEIRAGLALLPGFLALLPGLRVAVLAGRAAGLAAPVVHAACPGLPVLHMPHPSPTFVCTSPDVARRIRAALAEAAAILNATARGL